MPEIRVWLDDWEHQCCGDRRSVGDDIELAVWRSPGLLWEQRHDYTAGGGGGPSAARMKGRLVDIAWHPAVLEPAGDRGARVVGYGPGVPCESTDNEPDVSWAFEFTIDTDAAPPIDVGSARPLEEPSREGGVTIFLDFDRLQSDEDEEYPPRWFGYVEHEGDPVVEEGPFFEDAEDAVRWWKRRSERIFVRLNERETLWAGVGEAPEVSGKALGVFDENDPRGRPEGARETVRVALADSRARQEEEKRQQHAEDGLNFKRRRLAANLSVEDVALRVAKSTGWVEEIESGLDDDVSLSNWIDLVWATTEPWPEARETADRLWGAGGWFAFAPLAPQLEQAEDFVTRRMAGPAVDR